MVLVKRLIDKVRKKKKKAQMNSTRRKKAFVTKRRFKRKGEDYTQLTTKTFESLDKWALFYYTKND